MRIPTNFIFIIYFSLAKCTDPDSDYGYEFNRIELTPIHDAIIFNDIADIMSELENSMSSQFNNPVISNSESEEEVENLLSEYQQYLDKAHEKTVNYIRKTKGKNKVPLLRHEKYSKLKPIVRSNIDESKYYFDEIRNPSALFINKFLPQDLSLKPIKRSEHIFDILTSRRDDNNIINLPPLLSKPPSEIIMSSCYCKENEIPCKCGCKQCLIQDSNVPNTLNNIVSNPTNHLNDNIIKTFKKLPGSDTNNNNLFNIRIKIDIQLPNISMLNNGIKQQSQNKNEDDVMPKEIARTINLPFPFLNFPIPMELIGYKQNIIKDNISPVHKITIHKKKKYRFSNNNKKHKNKKLFALHHVNSEPQLQQNITSDHIDNGNKSINNMVDGEGDVIKNFTQNIVAPTTTSAGPYLDKISNQSLDTIYLTLNISKGMNNQTEEIKSENSIETDVTNYKDNITTLKPLRQKRETTNRTSKEITNDTRNKLNAVTTSSYNNNETSQVKVTKNISLDTISDAELLFWPSALKNQSLIPSKNITALILNREIKKTKLNMTENNIRKNRTMALEKAIFGNVDWNDVDTVVPVFISFVGKYVRGILTFCSDSICHSMKCRDKICHHRICTLDNRYKQIGHCVGNNDTDSVATMESIMDLPSNIAFEIVDILEEKMLGKLFGKVTLCINSKCSAFAVFKKKFQKAKCFIKELNLTGHCSNLKNVKVV